MAVELNSLNLAPPTPAAARLPAIGLCLMAGLIVGWVVGALPWQIAAVVVSSVAGSILAVRYPYAGTCLLLCTLLLVGEVVSPDEVLAAPWPVHDVDVVHGLPSAVWLLGLAILGAATFRMIFIDRRASRAPWWYLAVYAAILATAGWTGLRNGWLRTEMRTELIRFTLPVLFFYLAINEFHTTDRIRIALWLLFGVGALNAAILAFYYLTGRGVLYDAASGAQWSRVVALDGASLTTFVGMPLLACARCMCQPVRASKQLLLTVACLPFLFGLAFSFRRAEWIGAVGGGVLLFVLSRGSERVRMLRFLAPLAIVVFIVFGVIAVHARNLDMVHDVTSRLHTLRDTRNNSNRHHVFESRQTLRDIAREPFGGLGLAGRHGPIPEFPHCKIPTNIVHNAWVLIWMKFGLMGLLALVWISVCFLRRILAGLRGPIDGARRSLLLSLAAMVPLWLTQSLSGPLPWYPRATVLIAIFAAMAVNLARTDPSVKERSP